MTLKCKKWLIGLTSPLPMCATKSVLQLRTGGRTLKRRREPLSGLHRFSHDSPADSARADRNTKKD